MISIIKDLTIATGAALLLVLATTAAPALADGHDVCDGYEDASWCSGDSVAECLDGSTVPESEECPPDEACEVEDRSARGYCPGEDGHEAERDGVMDNSCEADGTCDDSCPHRSDCLAGEPPIQPATETPTEPAERLPETGVGMVGLVALGLALLTGGGRLLRITR